MALPQKVADRLARSPQKTPGSFRQLFLLSSTLFFISLGFYLGLDFGFRPYLESQVEELQNRMSNLAQQIPIEEQIQITGFYSQIVNFQKLLADHTPVSPLFAWLEKNTQVNVYYTSFNFRSSNNSVSISGVAESLDDLSEQLLVLENLPEIESANLGGVTSEEGLWVFDLELSLTPAFFNLIANSNQ